MNLTVGTLMAVLGTTALIFIKDNVDAARSDATGQLMTLTGLGIIAVQPECEISQPSVKKNVYLFVHMNL